MQLDKELCELQNAWTLLATAELDKVDRTKILQALWRLDVAISRVLVAHAS